MEILGALHVGAIILHLATIADEGLTALHLDRTDESHLKTQCGNVRGSGAMVGMKFYGWRCRGQMQTRYLVKWQSLSTESVELRIRYSVPSEQVSHPSFWSSESLEVYGFARSVAIVPGLQARDFARNDSTGTQDHHLPYV